MKLFYRLFVCLLMVMAAPIMGHHSFPAEYDADKPISLHGTVTKVEWTNPHIFIYVDVEDAATGEVVNWILELGAPNALLRLGWKRNDLKAGDEIDVEGSLARNGKPLVNAENITMTATGRRMLAGSSRNQG